MKNPEILLHYIDTLLKKSNFTKAARELYISQPYLTQLIKRLENKLGTPIINRQSTPFTLTKAGVIYYKFLEKAIADKHKLFQQLTPYVHPDKEIIKIGILSSLGTFLLPELLPDFLQKNSNIKIQLFETSPRISETQLLHEQIDCYIGQTPESLNHGIDFYINGSENYFVVIPPSSPFFQKNKFILKPNEYDITDILKQQFVVSSTNSAIRHQVDGIFQKFQIEPKIILESNNIITATNLAIKGIGLTISAASIIKKMTQTPINLLPLDPDLIQIKYFIAIKHGIKIKFGVKKLIKKFKDLNIHPKIS